MLGKEPVLKSVGPEGIATSLGLAFILHESFADTMGYKPQGTVSFTTAPFGATARITALGRIRQFAGGGFSAMTMNLKLGVLALFTLGVVAGGVAQNRPSKTQGKSSSRSSVTHHTPVRHKNSSVAMPDDAKKLNSDLAKLETETSKTIRPARSAPKEKAVHPAKTFSPQDRRGNPPINFTYNGKNGGSTSHGGTSHSAAAPVKASPRMR